MKAFTSILAALAVPAMFSAALAADETPGALAGYLPTNGELSQGVAVRVVLDESIAEKNKSIAEKFNALPEERRAELAKGLDALVAMEYTPDLFDSKEAYESYLASWKKAKLAPAGTVAMGMMPTGKEGIWKVLSATVDPSGRTLPLTISALQYDAKKNIWLSNNGELAAKPYEIGDRCVLGAQTGTEWQLTREDSLSKLSEAVRVTKTTDGEAVYVFYSFSEVSAVSGAAIAQGGYILRFPIVTKKAGLSKPGQK